jgi:hypothetical protein
MGELYGKLPSADLGRRLVAVNYLFIYLFIKFEILRVNFQYFI